MKKIEDLTDEVIARIAAYKKQALNGVSDGSRHQFFNVENAYKCVRWNYNKCGYRSPVIIVTENPLEMHSIRSEIKGITKGSLLLYLEYRLREGIDFKSKWNSDYDRIIVCRIII